MRSLTDSEPKPQPKQKRQTDPEFLAAIRERDCLLKGSHCVGRVESAHLRSVGAGGPDLCAVPLCHYHHRRLHRMGTATFQVVFGLNLWEVAFYLGCGWLLSGKTELPRGMDLTQSE